MEINMKYFYSELLQGRCNYNCRIPLPCLPTGRGMLRSVENDMNL